MKSKFPYIAFMEILEEGREKMVYDTMQSCSPALYDALYSMKDSVIFELKIELYELEWIEYHWKLIIEILNKKKLTDTEKKELLSIFAVWLKDLFRIDDSTVFDVLIIEEKINILKSMISLNSEWEQNIKKMKVSFEKSKRQLDARIKEMERGK